MVDTRLSDTSGARLPAEGLQLTDQQPSKSFKALSRLALVCIIGVIVMSLCAAGAYFGIKRHRISGFDSAFSKIRVGDAEANVTEVMGPPDELRTTDQYLFQSAHNVEGETGPGKKQLCYRVDTAFLPITWVITIDADALVRNKFRLD